MCADIAEIKKSAIEYMSRLAPGILDLAYDARFTLNFGGSNSLKDVYEGIGWLIEVIKLISSDTPNQSELNEDLVLEILEEITLAFQRKDYVYLADLLEYKIHPELIYWLEALV